MVIGEITIRIKTVEIPIEGEAEEVNIIASDHDMISDIASVIDNFMMSEDGITTFAEAEFMAVPIEFEIKSAIAHD